MMGWSGGSSGASRDHGWETLPFDHFTGEPGTAGWLPVSVAAQKVLQGVQTIMAKTATHHA
jgi:hypothetical protein